MSFARDRAVVDFIDLGAAVVAVVVVRGVGIVSVVVNVTFTGSQELMLSVTNLQVNSLSLKMSSVCVYNECIITNNSTNLHVLHNLFAFTSKITVIVNFHVTSVVYLNLSESLQMLHFMPIMW